MNDAGEDAGVGGHRDPPLHQLTSFFVESALYIHYTT